MRKTQDGIVRRTIYFCTGYADTPCVSERIVAKNRREAMHYFRRLYPNACYVTVSAGTFIDPTDNPEFFGD